jgi:hypothetical protein
MNRARLLAASAVLGLWAASADAADLRPEDAVGHIGETATVCGVGASAMFEANVQDQPTLLDLGTRFRVRFSPRLSMETIGRSSASPRLRSAARASM